MIIFAFILLIGLSGCVVPTFGTNIETIYGTGPMVSRSFEGGDFTDISLGGSFIVTYRHSASASATVVMQENLFEYHTIEINRGELVVRPERGTSIQHNSGYRPRLYIYAPFLESVEVSGAIEGSSWDVISAQNFDISIVGTGDLTIPLDVTDLRINVAGTGNVELLGNAVNAIVTIAGTGNVDLVVSDSLDVTISGMGSVSYEGSPVVTQSIAGMGSVRRR